MEFGNQQERLYIIGWLIGFVEGEGTLTITKSNKRKNGKYSLFPSLQISNTDIHLIEFAQINLKKLGIGSYIYHKKGINRADSHTLYCGGYKRLSKLIPIILPYLIAKKRQAELILEYVNNRKNLERWQKYSLRDLEIVKEIKMLNIKPKYQCKESPETIRQTWRKRYDDIVQSL